MGAYRLSIANAVKQDVRNIERAALDRILQKIRSLAEDPFPSGCRKLKGSSSSYRVRVGDYRIIYEVDSETRTVTVFHVRHRKDAYQK